MPPALPMEGKIEQRTVLSFLVCEGKSPNECWRQMCTVFSDRMMSKSRIWVWHKRFKQGRNNFKDDKHTGRPHTGRSQDNIKRIQAALTRNQRKTVHGLAEESNISKSSVHGILKKDLNLSKVATKMIPKELNDQQKAFRKRLCEENLRELQQNPTLMDMVVTGDKSWVSVLELETKQQSSAWVKKGCREQHLTKARRQRGVRKSMLTVFCDKQGVILAEFLPRGETVDTDQYLAVLRCMRENIHCKRPELWGQVGRGEPLPFLLHQDNASSHTSNMTIAFMGENSISLLAHPPNSPDLAPCDYFLFLKLKSKL